MTIPQTVRHCIQIIGFLFVPFCLQAGWQIAEDGKAMCVIVQQAGATEPEQAAARELANVLRQITGAQFNVTRDAKEISGRAIIVGPGPIATKHFPEINLASLGAEELVM